MPGLTDWNTAHIFELLGGIAAVQRHVAKHNHSTRATPTYGAVTMWQHRQRIGWEWLPVVLHGLVLDQHIKTPEDLLSLFTAPAIAPERTPTLEDYGL